MEPLTGRVRRWRDRRGLTPYAATSAVLLLVGSVSMPWFAVFFARTLPPPWNAVVTALFLLLAVAGIAMTVVIVRTRPSEFTISALMLAGLLLPTIGYAITVAADPASLGPMTVRVQMLVVAAGVVIRSHALLLTFATAAAGSWLAAMWVAAPGPEAWLDWAAPWVFVIVAAVVFRVLFEAERRRDEAARQRLRSQAHRDPLTQALNRDGLRDAVADSLVGGTTAWCAFIDVDGLKAANDVHGHDAGDAVLRAVAVALRGSIRAEDALARWGGDEFVVVGVGAAPDLAGLEQRLALRLARSGPVTAGHWPGVVSVGLAATRVDDHTPVPAVLDTLVAEADLSMYDRRTIRRAS